MSHRQINAINQLSAPGLSSLVALSVLCGVMAVLATACSNLPFIPGGGEASDKEPLVAFYNAMGGDEWSNSDLWLSELHVGHWYGVRYFSREDPVFSPAGGDAGTRTVEGVAGLEVNSNGLKGEIPPELGKLGSMSRVFMAGNQLIGEIPSQLGDLDNLTHLYLGGNQLSGEIPSELGKLGLLSYLSLGSNQLSGEIPSDLSKLRQLIMLDLSNNQLTGEIPSWLREFHRLSYLYLGGNCRPSAIMGHI